MKPYKCRVEYLESSGTQYIDLGLKGKNNLDFDYKVNFTNVTTSSGFGIGGEWENGKSLYLGLIRSNGNFAYHYANTNSPVVVLNSVSANTDYSIQGHMWSGEQYMVINGTKSAVGTITGTFEATQNIALFRVTSSSPIYCYAKIYYCKIWDNKTLVRDLIPVLDNNGRPAMYDNVSGQLFYNQGSGEFSYGRKIIPVEYLESTGTQYIDTGVYPTQLTETEYRCAVTGSVSNADSHLFGSRLSASSEAFDLAYMNTTPNGIEKFRFIHGTTTTQETTTSVTASQLVNPHTYYMSGTSFKVDGSEKMSFTTASFTGTYSLWLFGVNSAGSLHNQVRAQRVYKCKIWDNNTLVRDFIPAIDENNVPFMFDLVNCKIYENAGTGQFKVGANVEKSGNKNFLRKKLDMYLATLRKKRPYYCELEYLESTGTQYINTGLLSTANSKVDCVFGFSSMESGAVNNCAVFGGRSGTTSNTFTFFKLASATPQYFRFDFNGQPQVATANDLTWNATSKYRFEYNGANCITTNITTGKRAVLTRGPGSSFTPAPICLFCVNYSSSPSTFNPTSFMSGRIYKYWYTDGTNTIDLIPVLDWNYVPCMYDKISGQFFYNQGTGTFQYGREIHYVDYIKTDGAQYIDTGIIGNSKYSVETKVKATSQSAAGFVFGSRIGQNSDTYACLIHSNDRIGYRVGSGNFNYTSGYDFTDKPHKIKIANGVLYVDDVVVSTYCEGATVDTERNMLLFTLRTNTTVDTTQVFIGSMYSFAIKENTTLVRDYLPAIDSNGVPFMFDRVTHTIFDNAGTGAFKYPAREVEYLEGTGTQYIDTGVTGDLSTEINCEAAIVEAGNASVTNIMGNNVTSSRAITINMSANITNPSPSRIRFGNTDNTTVAGAINLNTFYKYTTNKDNLTVQDIEGTILNAYAFNATTAFTTNGNILIYKLGDTSTQYIGKIKVSSASIKNSGVLVRDFIPVFKDGSAGMLDKANNVFYSNAGSGSFSVGRIVESEWE